MCYDLKQAFADTATPVQLEMKRADKTMFDYRPLATIAMAVMIWTTKMAATEMLWYVGAAIACIGGSGSVFGLDYYVLPWLKKQWKKIPLVRRWYLFTD